MAMAELQVIPRFAIIFTFFAFHAILTSEGRSVKSAWKDEFRSIDNKNQMYEQASRFLTLSQSPWNDDHSEAGKKTVSSPTVHVQVADLGKIEAVYRDDFRPTNPGSSPGVGHPFVGLKKEAAGLKSTSSNEERLTVTETPGDFESTRPGHSPGVGHPSVGLKKEAAGLKSTSSNEERLTVTKTPGDFESTTPGHSPGVGHGFQSRNLVFQRKNEDPKA